MRRLTLVLALLVIVAGCSRATDTTSAGGSSGGPGSTVAQGSSGGTSGAGNGGTGVVDGVPSGSGSGSGSGTGSQASGGTVPQPVPSDTVDWDGGAVPVINVQVDGDEVVGWSVTSSISGFVIDGPDVTTHRPGHGEVHVWVDGVLQDVGYSPSIDFPAAAFDQGPHEIVLSLASNDGRDFTVDGGLLSGSARFDVAGPAFATDVTITVLVAGGKVKVDPAPSVKTGQVVEVRVTSDANDEVHVHGYDIKANLQAGQQASFSFRADVPGVFEVELENSGLKLFDLTVR